MIKTPRLCSDLSCKFLVQPVNEETLILNLRNHQCHHLDEVTTRIFRLCDGQTDQKALAEILEIEENIVDDIIEELMGIGILSEPDGKQLGRRELLSGAVKLGLATTFVTTLSLGDSAAAMSVGSCIQSSLCPTAQSTGGGNSLRGPQGCLNCCGTGIDTPPCGSSCPSNCSVCFCLYEYTCTNNGITPAPCNTTGPNICEPGSMDVRDTSGFCENPNLSPGDNIAQSCAQAKANAGSANRYFCCQCP